MGQAVLTGARDINLLKRQIISEKYRVLQLYSEPLLDTARASSLKEQGAATREGGAIFTPGMAVGFIEKITRTEQNLVVDGWAADAAARLPAVAVHVFVAGHDAAVGMPNLPRPDVATAINFTSSNVFGFHILAPVGSASGGDVHVFAQLHDSSFRELVRLHRP